MRPAATHAGSQRPDALTSRVERDIVGVLLAMTGAAALWWAGAWWWRATHAESTPAPRPPTLEPALLPAPHRFERRRDVALMLQHADAPVDAGAVEAASVNPRLEPGPAQYGVDRGQGSESRSRSDAAPRQDLEPRFTLDGGAFAEPPVAVEAAQAFQ